MTEREQATSPTLAHQSWTDQLGSILRFAWARIEQEKIIQLASSLTFNTVLAIVPLLAVVLSLFTAFPLFKEFSDALQAFMATSLMPPAISDIIMKYLNEFAIQASRLTTIGGGFLLMTVLLLIMSVDSALNDIWHVTRQRPIGQRMLVYWALITLGPVLTGASLWTTGFLARESLGMVTQIPVSLEMILKVIPFGLSGLGFSVLFAIVPNCKVRRTDALLGGFVTAIILEGMKFSFAYYVSQFSTYTVIYGAFAALPVFLIWIYVSWMGVLIGAMVAANLPTIRVRRLDLTPKPGSDLLDALTLLQCLERTRGAIPPGLSDHELMLALRLQPKALAPLLSVLNELGLVTSTNLRGQDSWVLTCDPDTTALGPLFDRLAFDRHELCIRDRPYLARALSDLILHQNEPTLANVLLHHDNTLIKQLQSKTTSITAGT
jgi:membrane protein